MENKIMYIVGYSKGSYDDYVKFNKFVTRDKEIAEKWCVKFNKLYQKIEEFVTYLRPLVYESWEKSDDDTKKEYNVLSRLYHKYGDINEINGTYIEEIKIK